MLWQPKGILQPNRDWRRGQGGAVATTTWNDLDRSANLSLDGTFLIVTDSAGGFSGIRSVGSFSSGKKFFKVTATTKAGDNGVGVGNVSASLSTYNDVNGIGYFSDGNIYQTGIAIASPGSYGQGAVISIAFDADAQLFWARADAADWNGNPAADPATGIGGISTVAFSGPYFAMAVLNANGDVSTGDFSGSGAPSGGFGAI